MSLNDANYITLIIKSRTRALITNQGILEINNFLGGLQKNIMVANNIKRV